MLHNILHDFTPYYFLFWQGNRHERADERYPHSELLLYKNLALSDAGMTQEALDHLETCKEKVQGYVYLNPCSSQLKFYLSGEYCSQQVYLSVALVALQLRWVF